MTQRREFLRQASRLAAGSLAAGSVAPSALAAEAATPEPGQTTWDMSWVDRVTGRYKMCFDAPEISDGTSLHQVRSFLGGYAAVYGLTDADLSAVLIVRHKAIPMVLGDALWSDGAWGEKEELKDPSTGEPTKRNPFVNIAPRSTYSLTWPDGALDKLLARGVTVLACDLALNNAADQLANRRKIAREEARKLVYDNLLPGVIKMPSGIFATCRAQGAGCGVMYAV